MFFIFPFEMLIWVVGAFVLFFLFLLFPIPMVIITIIIIWIAIKSTEVRSEDE